MPPTSIACRLLSGISTACAHYFFHQPRLDRQLGGRKIAVE
jgi:hypothetical protein